MAGEVLYFKRANIVHDVASELYGLFRVTKLPGNRVGIGIRYCFVVCFMYEFQRHFWREREGSTFVYSTCDSNPK